MIGSSARPARARLREQLAQRDLHVDLEAEGERRALVHERRDRDLPAVALPADDVLVAGSEPPR